MNTEIRDNKSGYPGNPIIDTDGSMNIKFNDCTFRDNYIEPDPDELPDVVFENCEIGGEWGPVADLINTLTREISDPPRFAGKRACQTLAKFVTLPAKSMIRRDSRVSRQKVVLVDSKQYNNYKFCPWLVSQEPLNYCSRQVHKWCTAIPSPHIFIFSVTLEIIIAFSFYNVFV